MTSKKFRLLAASVAAIMMIGGIGMLAACSDDSEKNTEEENNSTQTPPDDSSNNEGEQNTPVSNVKTYTYSSKNLLEDDLEFFTLMQNGTGDATTGIMPMDNWGSGKFSSIRHTITLEIGSVGLADDETADIHTAIDSKGLVDFATGDSKTALESLNLVNEAVESGWGENKTVTYPKDNIAKCNYKFTLTSTLKGNGASDGYQGEGTVVYTWYGVTDLDYVSEDGGYNLPVSQFAEMYVTGTLSHGTSTTSIVPDAGFYINSLMGTHLNDESGVYAYSQHTGGTNKELVYVTPKSLGMMYFNSGMIYVDEATGKITDTNVKYYQAPVAVKSFTLEDNGTDVIGGTLNMTVNETKTLTITPDVSSIYTIVLPTVADADGNDITAQVLESSFPGGSGTSATSISLKALKAGTYTVTITTEKDPKVVETFTLVVTEAE